MAKNTAVIMKCRFACHGRNAFGDRALTLPEQAELTQRCGMETGFSASVDCPHNTGGHGQRCKASHPDVDKVGQGVGCPYSFDYPYVLTFDRSWKPPEEIAEAVELMKKVSS